MPSENLQLRVEVSSLSEGDIHVLMERVAVASHRAGFKGVRAQIGRTAGILYFYFFGGAGSLAQLTELLRPALNHRRHRFDWDEPLRPVAVQSRVARVRASRVAERAVDGIGKWLPRRDREFVLGDIYEDLTERRAEGWSERKLLWYAWYQILWAFLAPVARWVWKHALWLLGVLLTLRKIHDTFLKLIR
jgi:hypothetical protein